MFFHVWTPMTQAHLTMPRSHILFLAPSADTLVAPSPVDFAEGRLFPKILPAFSWRQNMEGFLSLIMVNVITVIINGRNPSLSSSLLLFIRLIGNHFIIVDVIMVIYPLWWYGYHIIIPIICIHLFFSCWTQQRAVAHFAKMSWIYGWSKSICHMSIKFKIYAINISIICNNFHRHQTW